MKLTGELGSIVNVRMAFTDPENDNAPYDPASVSFRMRTPGQVVTSYDFGVAPEVEQEAPGQYLYRLTLAEEGTYRWTWTGASPQKAVVKSGSCDSVEPGA